MSFKAEFKVFGDPKFYQNGVAFATEAEAQAAADDKFSKWMMAEDRRVVESDEPVNYAWVDGEPVSVPA